MNPDAAIRFLVEALVSSSKISEQEVYHAFGKAGATYSTADRAFKFSQIAWGRVFLAGLGVSLPDEYFCFNAEGHVVASGNLSEEPHFQAATQIAPTCISHPSVQAVIMGAADVAAVNQALLGGSQPQHLVLMPSGIFFERPTEAGFGQAQTFLRRWSELAHKQEHTTTNG